MTRDSGESRIFFEADQAFSEGQPMEFSLVLEHGYPDPPIHVTIRGKIAKVEPKGGRVGVAVAIHSYRFEGLCQPEQE